MGVRIFFADSNKLSVRRIFSSTTRSLRFSAETSVPSPRRPVSRQLLLVLESASCAGNFEKGVAGLLSSGMDCARSLMVKSRVAVLACAVLAVCTNWIRSLTPCETACESSNRL
jgi:hypothetical protein